MSRTINGTHTECVHCAVHCRALVLILIMVPIFCTRCCRVCIWNLNISSIWFLLSNFSGWLFFPFRLIHLLVRWEKELHLPTECIFVFVFRCSMQYDVIYIYHFSLLVFSSIEVFFTSLTFASQMRTIHVFLKHSFKWSVIVMILWHPYFHPTNAQRECA